MPPFKRPTNTVFQSYALFPHLSVEDNVAFGLRRKGVPKDQVRRRVREELERVGLAAEAKRKPRQLSGGQQQRVALARALINEPAVLLLDEPLGALDLKLRKGLQVELKRIQRDVGITFVYVTHDQEEALTMSDRIAVMNHGVIEQLDPPEEVYERPRTEFVAGFIGVSNLMPGSVAAVSGRPGGRAPRQRPDRAHAGGWRRTTGTGATSSSGRRSCRSPGSEEPAPAGARASRDWWSPRSTWVPPPRWSSSWRATCRSRCWCPTRTRPSDSGSREPAHACACRGLPITCTCRSERHPGAGKTFGGGTAGRIRFRPRHEQGMREESK